MISNKVQFLAAKNQPNPNEIDYWIDLADNPYGGTIKYWNGTDWVGLSGSGHADLRNYYTKRLVNSMLAAKEQTVNNTNYQTKVYGVNRIDFSSNPDDLTLLMFKYDGTANTIKVPLASATNTGVLSSKDFQAFVKDHQLQELHTEMIDLLAEIRAQYQRKLIAGKNISINEDTNVISADDFTMDWDKVENKPEFAEVATSGDYNDLINKLQGSDNITINNNVIDVNLEGGSLQDSFNSLNDKIEAETDRAKLIEGSIIEAAEAESERINSEIESVADATYDLSARLNTEIVDRKDAISKEETNRNAAIKVETNRATAAEKILDDKIAGHTDETNAALALKADKSDTYTKAQVDAKVSATYKVKGSSAFADLPAVNVVGDVYNISDDFTLNDKPYDAGTNLVWTEDGWDALSGSFDTSAIEESIQTVADNLAQEILDRVAADNATNSAVTAVSNRVATTETKLNTLEGTGEGSVANALAEAKAYTDTEVAEEAAIARAAEQANATAIADEIANRTSGDTDTLAAAKSYTDTEVTGETAERIAAVDTINAALDTKVDKILGKQLSTNDYTTEEKIKLASIATNAEVNVQADWNADNTSDAYINNKPTTLAGYGITSSDVLETIKTVDGAGSGLDADTLDGKHYLDIVDGNVASATKLQTSRTIWGLSFDGSGNIYGDLSNVGLITTDTNSGSAKILKDCRGDGTLERGINTDGFGIGLYVNSGTALHIMNNGNTGIGITTPSEKLEVNGNTKATKFISTVATGTAPLTVASTTKVDNLNADMLDGNDDTAYLRHREITTVLDDNTLWSTMGTKSYYGVVPDNIKKSGYDPYTYGEAISIVSSSARFEIYATHYSSQYADSPNTNAGLFYRSGFNANKQPWQRFVTYHDIANGNCDWYGVSWSENSSSPDCTRIGNMDMHRTLPILSAMKPFAIVNNRTSIDVAGVKVPVSDDFSTVLYNTNVNDMLAINSNTNDIFIRIPEFWYCDDYVASTKTHNLKICPHQKPGWLHHKEAYVAAYEGKSITADNVTYYRSIVNQIPTVSKSRTTFRTEARANGSNKWNIYTYEEHRAICHLFMVEYATRHSLKAVNTALTAEGFRQGGLGNGCTTGAITLNGATVYSFVPTGSTDSLGTGSGEVTVTVATDSGNVTRTVNRYRGIENPFGHVWKHCDDIISQLSNGTRIYYFCSKPEHFATNKNEYYTPLIAGPGGTAMQGYKKEIKASINCDFFAMSVGGGAATYWCDYNYDNDDTSEHCLLIGGRSDYGGVAGLFYLHSLSGVARSAADVGSRLTYLPWAE